MDNDNVVVVFNSVLLNMGDMDAHVSNDDDVVIIIYDQLK